MAMTRRVTWGAAVLLVWAAGVAPAAAQDASDPREAMPERPSVATHAWTVAPKYAELEAGFEWDRNTDASFAFSTPAVLKIGVASRAQLGVQASTNAASGTSLGFGDAGVVLKYRVADALPVVGALAVEPGIKLPTGPGVHGTSTTDASLLLISSHKFGPFELDVNAGYTRRSGSGVDAPKNATVWTASSGGPICGALGFAAEIFGFPATSGPAGAPASEALLVGPTFTVRPWVVVDAGGIVRLHGEQPNAIYSGFVYNFGRIGK